MGLRVRRVLSGIACCLLVGCAAPARDVFVLLPDPDGSAGRIRVANSGGVQVLSQPRQATYVETADRPPTAPVTLQEEEVERLFGEALSAQPREPAVFILYFKPASDELTPESEKLLPEILRATVERRPADMSVVGHTDTAGAQDYNYRLSLRRAERVTEILASMGVDRAIMEIKSHGEEVLLIETGDDVSEPRNRRVEVTVR